MLRDDFLLMQRLNLETKNDEDLNVLYDCFEEVLKKVPKTTEIDSKKSVESCYEEMKDYAYKHQKNGSFFFSSVKAIEFIENYLEVSNIIKQDSSKTSEYIDLTDFL